MYLSTPGTDNNEICREKQHTDKFSFAARRTHYTLYRSCYVVNVLAGMRRCWKRMPTSSTDSNSEMAENIEQFNVIQYYCERLSIETVAFRLILDANDFFVYLIHQSV